MKVTSEDLRQIIKEEFDAVLNEKKGKKRKAAKKKKRKKKKKAKAKKKDACYNKVKSRYDVWPSAYASGALVKCRKVGAANWGNSTNEDLIPGGLGDKLKGSMEEQHKQLAKMHDVSVQEIDAQVQKGVKVEMEHTDSEEIAHEIAMEHVYEDPEYYDKLESIETLDEKKKKKKKKSKPKKKAGTESSKESSLHDWFGRKGAKGKKKGWVDCNSPDGSGGYKSCGRSDGEKRKKYPSCRPTPGACKEKGKGKSWGKKAKKGKKK